MDFFEGWDARRSRHDRPSTAPVAAPNVPAGGGTAYGLAALQGEVENLVAVPIGSGRNDQLNRSAVKLYGLAAAGELDERLVTETLGAADGGLDYPATRKTLDSARQAVYTRLGARVVPESRGGGTSTQETTTDPFGDGVYIGPVEGVAGSPSSSGPTSRSEQAPSTDDDEAYRALVVVEARKVRLRRDASKLIADEDAAREFRVPPSLPTLADELAIPDEPIRYAVDKLIPAGANVLLTAQYKTGKTTTVNNLARAFADGVPFLDRFEVAPFDGRVALWNYEVDRDQFRRWLRDAGIENPGRIAPLTLRGYRAPLIVPHVEDWAVEWLIAHETRVWIVDPFARAFTGCGDENDNGQVGVFLDTLDVIKERAGVDVLVMPNHTGRAEFEQGDERGRGATRLDDWADVRWLLTRDKNDVRYFRATGRDVEVDEGALVFDEATRHLRLTGGDRWVTEQRAYRDAVEAIVANRPGVNGRELREGVRQILRRASSEKIDGAVDALIEAGRLHKRRSGHAIGHFPGRDTSSSGTSDDPFS